MINTTTGESIDPREIKHINEFRKFIEPTPVVRRVENIGSSDPKNKKSNFGILVLGLVLELVLVVVFII